MKKCFFSPWSWRCSSRRAGKTKGSNTLIRPVKTAQVSSQSVIRKDFSGIVEAVEYVRLAFRVSGQIISLPVVEGQRVKRGN